jgi:hypothetical protein
MRRPPNLGRFSRGSDLAAAVRFEGRARGGGRQSSARNDLWAR